MHSQFCIRLLISCKSTVIVIAVTHIFAAIAIFLLSSSIVVILFNTPSLNHSQSYFKISIALSDLLVAVLVIPSIINNLFIDAYEPLTQQSVNITAAGANASYIERSASVTLAYQNTFGACFFTSSIVSIYTLLFAATDRFMAIFKPLGYRKFDMKKYSKRACALVWMFAIAMAILPMVLSSPNLYYGSRFGVISAVNGSLSPIYYAVLTVLPLPIMWAITVATYVKTAQHMRVSRSISSSVATRRGVKVPSTELTLARTLGIMVGSFTMSLLPAAVMIAVGSLTPGVNIREPRSLDPAAFSRVYAGEFFAYVCFMFNTVWNFFIYNARNAQFRAASRRLRKRLLLRFGCGCLYGPAAARGRHVSASSQSSAVTGRTHAAAKSVGLTSGHSVASAAASSEGVRLYGRPASTVGGQRGHARESRL